MVGAYPPPNPIPLLTAANYEVYTPYPNTSACNSVDKIFSFKQDINATPVKVRVAVPADPVSKSKAPPKPSASPVGLPRLT
jgi:hypothetical protein